MLRRAVGRSIMFDSEYRIMKKLVPSRLVPHSPGIAPRAPSPRTPQFNGLDLNLGNLYRVSKAQSRSISPENFTGEKGKAGMATEGTGKGAARDLGQGWKVSPSVASRPGAPSPWARSKGPAASSRSG